MSFNEKRLYQRYPVEIPVSFFDPNLKRDVQAQTCDISIEGICLVTEYKLAPGSYLDISLKILNGSRKVLHKARVIWVGILHGDIYRVGFKLEEEKIDPISIALKSLIKKTAE